MNRQRKQTDSRWASLYAHRAITVLQQNPGPFPIAAEYTEQLKKEFQALYNNPLTRNFIEGSY